MRGNRMIDLIGNTPMVELRHIVPDHSARVLVKLESQNPTGSMKDRAALAMIQTAADDGRLSPNGTVVEYTGGSMGTSLAFVCAGLGFRCRLVSSDAFSQEKRDNMVALGAELVLVSSENRKITQDLIKTMIETARRLSQEPGYYWTDQLNNADATTGYFAMADEIWQQSEGKVTAFVHAVGTSHSLHGTTMRLWEHRRDIHVVAVEPAESPIISEGRSGAHRIEGIGLGFIVPHWQPNLVNEVMTVSTDDAKAMARRLAREEALMAGASTGANVVAALRLAERLGPGHTVVTVAVDDGIKYLSTDVYRPS